MSRLELVFKRWLTLSEVKEEFKSLFDFMIRDQFLSTCSPDVRVFLMEKGNVSNSDMATAADLYRSAHSDSKYKFNKLRSESKGDLVNKVKPVSEISSAENKCENKKQYVPKCYLCGKKGHIRPQCPELSTKGVHSKVNFIFESELKPKGAIVDPNGEVNSQCAEVSLDTGCCTVLVNPKFVSGTTTGPKCTVYDFLGRPNLFPTAEVNIKSKFFTGTVMAVVAPIKFTDVLLGMVPVVTVPSFTVAVKPLPKSEETITAVIQTRAASRKSRDCTPIATMSALDLPVDKASFPRAQQECTSLKSAWNAYENDLPTSHRGRSVKYKVIDNLLYRVCEISKDPTEVGDKQLVVPKSYRPQVLELAHEGLFAGHFSHRKTAGKIYKKFFWPGIGADVERFCKSCEACQKFTHKGRVKPVPMSNMPLMSEPFSKFAIDLIGPIAPMSNRKHKYILTIIDCATRFPEAIPLREIDTISIAESLVEVFSRVGVPNEILSDNGSQFKSDLMKEIHRLLSIQAIHSSPYHATSNGCVERMNGTLKAMLKKTCIDHPEDWDRYIPAVLFAYREIPNDTLKFSPFELLYGRNVRGPLTILHELFTNESLEKELRTSYQHVLELRQRLEEGAEVALANAKVSSHKYKEYFDKRAKPRKLEAGDEVLLLLPSSNKLIMQWKGPFEVVECRNLVDYVIKVNGKLKLYHINMLKKIPQASKLTGCDERSRCSSCWHGFG